MSPLELERVACPLSAWTGADNCCQWCNTSISNPRRRSWCSNRCARAWEREHVWRHARAAAKRRAKYHCVRPGCTSPRRDCEVNHITPRNGQGYGQGCHHHAHPNAANDGGLEVLCHAHHAEVTAAQAADRAQQRRSARTLDTHSDA